MNRLMIESIEGRITLGIVMFVATMILLGWVAINEPGRMASFTEQQEGRAIERGAEIYAASCSGCHGVQGRGTGQAPALNNPQFFGYDFTKAVNDEIIRLQREQQELLGIAAATPPVLGVIDDLTSRRAEIQDTLLNESPEDRALLVELGNIDARLVDDAETVQARLDAIAAGEALELDNNPELSTSELETRRAALAANIPNRLREIDLTLNGDGTEENVGLLAERQAILDSFAAAELNGYMPRLAEWDQQLADGELSPLAYSNLLANDAIRLTQIGFGGTLTSYITTTLIHGRPGSNVVWGTGGMVSWSQRGGGPLRDDEIGDVVAYILNWDKGTNWSVATDLNSVQQFARLHQAYSAGGGAEPVEYTPTTLGPSECSISPECVAGLGTVAEIAASLPEGDAANGSLLYSTLGCAGCHVGGAVGPNLTGTWERVETERLVNADHTSSPWTAAEYVVSAILYPGAYIVPPYTNAMPATFGQNLTGQDVADLVAYIREQ